MLAIAKSLMLFFGNFFRKSPYSIEGGWLAAAA